MLRVSRPGLVECVNHGWQAEAFVCQHVARSLQTGVPVGFHWSTESDAMYPDAWCTVCEEARVAAGGDWTPEVEQQLRVRLLCGACYEQARSIWLHGGRVVQ
jgi:hypothetical protein